jgi:hypothetical protein|tara:strand:+ start:971 stop:1195 length:225 start_codon:yes stop_codon:yes gene_type:complete
MPKYIVKEGLVDKFMGVLFGGFVKNLKSKAIKDLTAKDPEFGKKLKAVEKRRKEVEDYIIKNRKKLKQQFPELY